MFTGLLFGVAPARRGFRVDPNEGLRDTAARGGTSAGSRGASRLLVVAEIALAMILVIGAGLMVKSLLRLQAQDAGFRPDGLLTFQFSLPTSKYDSPDKIRQTVDAMIGQLRAIPGIEGAGAINMIPLQNFGMNGGFTIVGRPPFAQQDRAPIVEYRVTTPGYFGAMGIPMKRGVDFSDRDTATSQPVAIINDTMAQQFWPGASPIGQRLQLGWDPPNVSREIVGVVGDTRSAALSAAPVAESYVPFAQAPLPAMGMVLRSEVDRSRLLPLVRQRISAIDADLPIMRAQSMQTVVEASAGGTRLSSVLTSVFALLAGVLASLGIYSLIAYSVAQRTREIGIRLALGANRRTLIRLIVGEGLGLAGIGIAIGLAGSLLLTRLLNTMLYQVSPIDAPVILGTCAAVLIVTMLASYVPARRALRVDPMIALRAE
jgi:putative ABC transport system permease protein